MIYPVLGCAQKWTVAVRAKVDTVRAKVDGAGGGGEVTAVQAASQRGAPVTGPGERPRRGGAERRANPAR